jgi:hypothetical protein
VTYPDGRRVGLDHDVFSDLTFRGIPRDAKDKEESTEDVRQGKSYLSLIMFFGGILQPGGGKHPPNPS